MKQIHYVYITTHNITGEYYVGKRTTSKNSIEQDGFYYGSGKWVTDIKNKSILSKTIFGVYDTFQEASDVEYNLIAEHIENLLCMNMRVCSSPSSFGQYGRIHTDETKEKMSAAHTGDKHYMYGKTHSEEHKQKLSEIHMGKTHSEKTRAKMSKSRTGEKNMQAKLTAIEAKEIKIMLRDNVPQRTIAEKFNISISAVSLIKVGKNWSHVII
jgi:hypothetical protein